MLLFSTEENNFDLDSVDKGPLSWATVVEKTTAFIIR
jgi:hypothetical protein